MVEGKNADQSFLPSLHSLTNLVASSPVSFLALASFSQCMPDECFLAGVAVAAGGAGGGGGGVRARGERASRGQQCSEGQGRKQFHVGLRSGAADRSKEQIALPGM